MWMVTESTPEGETSVMVVRTEKKAWQVFRRLKDLFPAHTVSRPTQVARVTLQD